MSVPRVPIETTFKKVREFLFAKTSGTQIPWEHTSLVGEFYFNLDTIYDGAAYSSHRSLIRDIRIRFLNRYKTKRGREILRVRLHEIPIKKIKQN
mgnify:CR=1 FL=1